MKHSYAWMVVRNSTNESVKIAHGKGRNAKIVADVLKEIQDSKRKARGLDTDEKRPVAVQ